MNKGELVENLCQRNPIYAHCCWARAWLVGPGGRIDVDVVPPARTRPSGLASDISGKLECVFPASGD